MKSISRCILCGAAGRRASVSSCVANVDFWGKCQPPKSSSLLTGSPQQWLSMPCPDMEHFHHDSENCMGDHSGFMDLSHKFPRGQQPPPVTRGGLTDKAAWGKYRDSDWGKMCVSSGETLELCWKESPLISLTKWEALLFPSWASVGQIWRN